MLDAEKWAKAKGFNAAYLWSNTRSEDFYRKCGYEKLKSGEYARYFRKEF